MDVSIPAGMDAELDSLLSNGGSESATTESMPPPVMGQEAQSAPETKEPAQPAQPAQPEAAPVKTEEVRDEFPLDDEIGEPEVREYRGKKEWHFTEDKGRRLVESHNFAKGLREAIPDLTVDAAKEHYAAYAEVQKLTHALQSGDPVTFMKHWAEKSAGNPQAFTSLALEATNALLDVDRNVFEAEVATPIVSAKMDFLQDQALQELQQAQRSGDQNAIKQANERVFAAQYAAWALTGQYKQSGQSQGPDPFAAQRQRFEQEKTQFQQMRQAEETKRRQALEADFTRRLDGNAEKLLQAKIASVAQYFPNPNFQPVTTKYLAQTVKDRLGENKPWMDTYQIARDRALRSGDARELEAVEKRYLARVESIIVPEIRKLISAETKAAVDKAQQKHAAAQQSQRREVTGNGKPAPQSIVTPPRQAQSPGSWQRQINAEIDAMLG